MTKTMTLAAMIAAALMLVGGPAAADQASVMKKALAHKGSAAVVPTGIDVDGPLAFYDASARTSKPTYAADPDSTRNPRRYWSFRDHNEPGEQTP